MRTSASYLDLYQANPIVAPHDLSKLVERLVSVPRFIHTEYPEGIFNDSVQSHTKRCVAFAQTLELPEKEEIERTLWIHDMPELVVTDYTVIEKEDNPQFEAGLDVLEDKAARELLNEADQIRFFNFNTASDYLKERISETQDLTKAALVAKVIDGIDGYITFNRDLARYVASDAYQEGRLPPERALRHSFNGKRKFQTQIQKLPEGYHATTLDLLEYMEDLVISLWRQTPEDRWPDPMREYINA